MPTSPKRAQFVRVLALSLMASAVSSCALIETLTSATDTTPPASVPCEALEHFRASRADTDGTIQQAIEFNRIFDRFCAGAAANTP